MESKKQNKTEVDSDTGNKWDSSHRGGGYRNGQNR